MRNVLIALLLCSTIATATEPLQFEERTPKPKLFRLIKLTSLGRLDTVVDQLKYSVAVVKVPDASGRGASEGSGTYIGEGFVLTAQHVVEDGTGAVTIDLGGEMIPGRVVAVGQTDQALIELSRPTNAPAVSLATKEVGNGETVIAAGFGIGPLRFWSNRPGGYSADGYSPGRTVHREYLSPRGGRGSIPGDSGGPVFNENGELLSNLWGGNGDNTFAVTNTETRRFIANSAGRFPRLGRILRGVVCRDGSFCNPTQGSSCSPGQPCYQGGNNYSPGPGLPGSPGSPGSGSRSIVPSPSPSFAAPAQPAPAQPTIEQPYELNPPANAFQPQQVPLQYVAPREDQLVEILQRMREDNPELFRGARGPIGTAGPAGNSGQRGARGIAGPSGQPGSRGPAGSAGERGPAGERGQPGPRGPAGQNAELTAADLEQVAVAVLQALPKKVVQIVDDQGNVLQDATLDLTDPAPVQFRYRSDQFSEGGFALSDSDRESIIRETLTRVPKPPSQQFLLVDGKTRNVIDAETYAPGEPIVLDVQAIMKAARPSE